MREREKRQIVRPGDLRPEHFKRRRQTKITKIIEKEEAE